MRASRPVSCVIVAALAGLAVACTFPNVTFGSVDASAIASEAGAPLADASPVGEADAAGNARDSAAVDVATDSSSPHDATTVDVTNDGPGHCSMAANCPMYQACDTLTGMCTSSCGGPETPCNGGCCSGNVCQEGIDAGACGTSGQDCTDCTATCNPGPVCLMGKCGCTSSLQCVGDLSSGCGPVCSNNACN